MPTPAGSSGLHSPQGDRQRYTLPDTDVGPGRSQPKRTPPRRNSNPQLLHRIARGVAAFAVSLVATSLVYGLVVSRDFADLAFENGATTSAMALLIGCFTLPSSQRHTLGVSQHLLACLIVLAITPWTYAWGNQLESRGVDLATGFNFVFEIMFAVVLYHLIARRTAKAVKA